MDKPLLYDIYSGAGGAAKGYYDTGFRVVGVDHLPQPHYPFEFIQMDAFEFLERYMAGEYEEAAAFHASPPCQYYTRLRHLPWLRGRVYWRSIPPTRLALQATGKPYILENVEDARWDMESPATLCGYSLGLELLRHRCFETWPFLLLQPAHRKHDRTLVSGRASLSKRHHGGGGFKEINRDSIAGHGNATAKWRRLMAIDWMTGAELAQAIPPVYTRWVGEALIKLIESHQNTEEVRR